MEISKAQKLKREAEMQISEIINALGEQTGCYVNLYVNEDTMIGGDINYRTSISLTLK